MRLDTVSQAEGFGRWRFHLPARVQEHYQPQVQHLSREHPSPNDHLLLFFIIFLVAGLHLQRRLSVALSALFLSSPFPCPNQAVEPALVSFCPSSSKNQAVEPVKGMVLLSAGLPTEPPQQCPTTRAVSLQIKHILSSQRAPSICYATTC
jgi:hypothetical protein